MQTQPDIKRLSVRIRGKGIHPAIGMLTGAYLFPGIFVTLFIAFITRSAVPIILYALGYPLWVFGICDRWMLVPVSRTIFGPVSILYGIIGTLLLIGTVVPRSSGALWAFAGHAFGYLIAISPLAFIAWLAWGIVTQRKRSLQAMKHAQMVATMAPNPNPESPRSTIPDANDSEAWGIGPG